MARSNKRNLYIDALIEMILQGASRKTIFATLKKELHYEFGIKSLDKQIRFAKEQIKKRLEKNADYYFALGQQRLEKITLLAFQSKNYRVALDATKTILQLAGFMKGGIGGYQRSQQMLHGGMGDGDIEATAEGSPPPDGYKIIFTEAKPPEGYSPPTIPEEKKDSGDGN